MVRKQVSPSFVQRSRTPYLLTQTQARDVGALLHACPSYVIDSVRGFDFFPQTQYVIH